MTRDIPLEAAVDRVADLLHLRIGLRRDTTLRGRLVRAVREQAALQGEGPTAYADRLLDDEATVQRLLDRVTVQETGFFRHPEHFDVLVAEVLPRLAAPVTIWSAACANGQEAYSLAMVLEELGIEGSVIATDVSTAALARTREARYRARELNGVSPDRLARHFTRHGDTWQVNASLRNRVTVLHHNLVDPLPAEVRSCEVVLCRNVLIYLTAEQVRAFLDRVADALPADATLLVGAAETIWPVSDRFRATPVGDTFLYRRREPAPAPPATEARPRPDAPRVRAVPAPSALPTPTTSRRRRATIEPDSMEPAVALEQTAQVAMAAGDYDTAVVAFRKCAYMRPHDPIAQLHLGLALEAAGDGDSARRVFAVARRALLDAGPDASPAGLKGYAPAELRRLLESKR